MEEQIDSYLDSMILIDNLNDESNKYNNGNSDHPDNDSVQIRTSIVSMIDRWRNRLVVTLKL